MTHVWEVEIEICCFVGWIVAEGAGRRPVVSLSLKLFSVTNRLSFSEQKVCASAGSRREGMKSVQTPVCWCWQNSLGWVFGLRFLHLNKNNIVHQTIPFAFFIASIKQNESASSGLCGCDLIRCSILCINDSKELKEIKRTWNLHCEPTCTETWCCNGRDGPTSDETSRNTRSWERISDFINKM